MEFETTVRSHAWKLHVPRHSGEGVITSRRYCDVCPASLLLVENRDGAVSSAVIAGHLEGGGGEERWVRDQRGTMRPLEAGPYREWLDQRIRRNGVRPAPRVWSSRDGGEPQERSLRAVPKEDTPPYRRMLTLHDWDERECATCGAERRPALDRYGELTAVAVLLPGEWEYHYVPARGELTPATMEEFARAAQMDYAREATAALAV